jgi:hypothetical protein
MWVTERVRREVAEGGEERWCTVVSRMHVGADFGSYYWVPAADDDGDPRHGDGGMVALGLMRSLDFGMLQA